ncbi:hypothetical protein [Bacteroides salyersiae]|uniref:hypothetical protein n=1 Tax=Bacteroides salyersiae TaxID=291644 RepID=UPI001E3276C1|nr:hypothetical protein [Bacteroides salyersiae]
MNYLKRFAILLLPLIMIACNDDDNLNTGTATVEFQSAEIEIKELTSSLNLPIVVKGENNGLMVSSINSIYPLVSDSRTL